MDKPERVQFRLTPNLVSAFGLSGVEGVFRGSCESALRVMRDNSDTLMHVLHTFVHDPLVEWKNLDEKFADRDHHNNHHRSAGYVQHKFKIMSDIMNRLRGLNSAESLPLSVDGHVQFLIREASCEENLSRMYIGWMPWL